MMKKLVSIIITLLGIMILLFLFSACTDEASSSPGKSTISETELTEREDFMLSSLTEHSFVYDFTLDGGIEEITVFVEKYEFGERQDYPVSSLSMAVLESEGSLLFSVARKDYEAEERSLTIGIQSGGEWSSGMTSDSFSSDNDAVMGTLWVSAASDGTNLTVTEGEVLLAAIIYGDGEEGISTLTQDFYEDADANLAEIEDYEAVYLLKAVFSSEAADN